jgi:hypothetical protein
VDLCRAAVLTRVGTSQHFMWFADVSWPHVARVCPRVITSMTARDGYGPTVHSSNRSICHASLGRLCSGSSIAESPGQTTVLRGEPDQK